MIRFCCFVLFLGLSHSVLLWGCATDLAPGQEQVAADGGQNGPPLNTKFIEGPKVTKKEVEKGVTEVVINSTDDKVWVYFSFSKGDKVEPKDAKNTKDWDIAFQRYKIASNSGISGSGGAQVAMIDKKDLKEVTAAPKEGYVEDKEDSKDEDEDPDLAFLVQGNWYQYNFTEHTLKARKRVYVVKTPAGEYYKVQFLKYYDGKGNSGFPTFHWSKLEPPK